jgi:hypothetical protein
MNTKFLMMTPEILHMENLTSTDKLVLALNRSMQPYFASNKYASNYLGMTASTVRKSITKLRKLGLWKETSRCYSGSNATATGVAQGDTRVSAPATRVADKGSFSPMKTPVLLERILEKNKKEGIESAAVASPLSHSPQTVLKKVEPKTPVTSESQEIKISGVSGSEAPFNGGVEATGLAVPPGPTGKPMTKADMTAANFVAMMDGKPEPFTAAQVAAGSDGNPWLAHSAEDFDSVFGRRAG